MRLSTLSLLAVMVAPSASLAQAPKADLTAGPRVVVCPLVGAGWDAAKKSHPHLVDAFRDRFGTRVIDADTVLAAQKEIRLWPAALTKPKGVAKLAEALDAERAVVVVVEPPGAKVFVYSIIGNKPTRSFKVPKLRSVPLTQRDGRRISKIVAERAWVLLASSPEEPVSIELDLTEETAAKELWATSTEPAPAAAGPGSDELVEEEQREARMRDGRAQAEQHVLFTAAMQREPGVVLAVGLGLGTRQADTGGSLAPRVIAIETGVVPALSLFGRVSPLQLVPSLNGSRLANLALEVHFQRALTEAVLDDEIIPVDDDALVARLGYGLALWSHPLSPRLGIGLGGGWARTQFDTDRPVPSTLYTFAEAHARGHQPIYRPYNVALEGLFAVRPVLDGASAVQLGPGWQAEMFFTSRPMAFVFARAGVRAASFRGWQGASFTLAEQTTQFLLEVGGYY